MDKHINKTDETLMLGHIMADQAEDWIALHIIKPNANIIYIPTIIILYSVNDGHYILEH